MSSLAGADGGLVMAFESAASSCGSGDGTPREGLQQRSLVEDFANLLRGRRLMMRTRCQLLKQLTAQRPQRGVDCASP